MIKSNHSAWYRKERHFDRRPFLMMRNKITAACRNWFAQADFTEVECSNLVVSPGLEAHLHGFSTQLIDQEGIAHRRYLHTSPEFSCKKLLAAGETRIFDLARVYRNRERTKTHSPEFTLLEWYRANEPYQQIIADSLNLVRLSADVAESQIFSWQGKLCIPQQPARYLTVCEAFKTYADIDLLATIGEQSADRDALAAQCALKFGDHDSWSDMFSRILVEKIEPNLGIDVPTVLYEYPIIEAALARACQHDPRLAERFELYICGVELANGFGELNDVEEQRRRFEIEIALKERLYGERYPIDENFLDALREMPPACGVALGFDRLVMLAAGAQNIDQVRWTPVE